MKTRTVRIPLLNLKITFEMATENVSFPYVDFNNDLITEVNGDPLISPTTPNDLAAMNTGFFAADSEDSQQCLCYPKDTEQETMTVTIDGYGAVGCEPFIGPRPVPPRPKP